MDLYCVFGNPIKQSRSPYIHKEFAKQTQQALFYNAQFVDLKGFTSAVQEFIKSGGKGANVTAPFKEEALAICDQLSETANKAGAVNTLSFVNGKIIGDNTDGYGLVQDLFRNEFPIKESHILLLGAGGAAKGVITPLLAQMPANITIANRTAIKAEQLCQQFNSNRLQGCGLHSIPLLPYDLIINATSASLSGAFPDISSEIITEHTACYDMAYSKKLTPFLSWCEKQGAVKVVDGLGMLVGQAAVSFQIWRNVIPEIEIVIKQLKLKLKSEQA